jgi:hypothetical protein
LATYDAVSDPYLELCDPIAVGHNHRTPTPISCNISDLLSRKLTRDD